MPRPRKRPRWRPRRPPPPTTQPESKDDSSYWDDESDDDEDRVRTHPLLDAARARWARQEALRPGDRRW